MDERASEYGFGGAATSADAALEQRMSRLLDASRTLLELVAQRRDENALLRWSVKTITDILEVRYGAIGILDENGLHRRFVHSGEAPEQALLVAQHARGQGALHGCAGRASPQGADSLRGAARVLDFPAQRRDPLLALPLCSQGRVYGTLYLGDKLDNSRFAALDELVAAHFAQYLSQALEKTHEIERVRANDEAHRHGEERHRLLLQLAPEPIFVIQDGYVVLANESALRAMEARDLHQLAQQPALDFVVPEQRQAIGEHGRRIARGQRVESIEVAIRNVAGRIAEFEVSGARIDYLGRPALLGVARDVSAQKRSERELRTLHQLSERLNRGIQQEALFGEAARALRTLLQADLVSIAHFDRHGTLRRAAWEGTAGDCSWASFETAFPRDADDQPLPALAADPGASAQFADHAAALAAHGIASVAVLPMLHQRMLLGQVCIGFASRHEFGEEEVRVAMTIAEHLAIAVARKQSRDKIRRLNAELVARVRRRTRELENANHELEAFTYSVSHDLRAPLRAVNGYSQILIDEHGGTLDTMARHHLGRIVAASRRMGQLIDDLLRLSRVDRERMQLRSIDLAALAESVVAKLRDAEPQRRVEAAVARPDPVQADAGLMRIVLENLLGNAWKYTGRVAQPRVEFDSVEHNGRIAYFVRDNGAGFDMAFAGRLFTPFQRLHRPVDFEGTGIGLALVRRILHRLGGRIWAEAAPNRGATFYFTLWEDGIPEEFQPRSP